MQLKTIEIEGVKYAALDGNGFPVYVHTDGKEIGFDAPAATAKISQLNGEAKGHREAKEAALDKLKNFEGIEDPAFAMKAIETIKNLDAKKLIDAGEVEKVKEHAKKAFDEQYTALEARYKPIIAEKDALQNALFAERLGGAFSRSAFIQEKLAVPADIMQARFGSAFKFEEDGHIVGYDSSGTKIYSRTKPGEIATFDEALEILVDAYPHRDNIVKGGGRGTGGNGAGGGAGGMRVVTRDEFNKLPPDEQRKIALDVPSGKAKIIDAV